MTRSNDGPPEPKPGILDIQAYVGGKSKVEGIAHPVKLSSNENILGCSPAASAAYVAAAQRLNLYPDGRAGLLRQTVSEKYGLEPDRLIFGCGSDEIFALLNQTFLEPGDNMVQGQYGFAAFSISARACQAEVRYAPEPDLRIDVDEMLNQVDERTRLMFVANPGNPTGTCISGEEVRRLHAGLPRGVILVLDGAYREFVADPDFEDGLSLARQYDNVVMTRTFSKIHGLAGLRVGWAYGSEALANAVNRIRLPFNVNIPAMEAAAAALGDEAFQRASIDLVERWRPWLIQQLGGLGLDVTPSSANFVLVGFPAKAGRTAAQAEAFLASRGYLVRSAASYGLPEHLRITIGLDEHNRAVIDLLAAFLGRKL
jgi:histidinol-phosphate aminotransferase